MDLWRPLTHLCVPGWLRVKEVFFSIVSFKFFAIPYVLTFLAVIDEHVLQPHTAAVNSSESVDDLSQWQGVLLLPSYHCRLGESEHLVQI